MPTMSFYGQFPANATGGTASASTPIDFLSDTIKVALTTSTYSPNQDTHQWFSDVTNEVANGNGYTSGGTTLASKTVTYTGATNKTVWDAADPSWTATGSGFTARYAVVYKDSGTSSTSPLIGYLNFGSDSVLVSGDTLTVAFDATNGVWYSTVA